MNAIEDWGIGSLTIETLGHDLRERDGDSEEQRRGFVAAVRGAVATSKRQVWMG